MGYALLWIENLIVLLLLMALIVACVGRLRRRWLRIVLWVPVPLVLLSGYALQTVFTAVLQFRAETVYDFWPPKVHWFWQMLALTLAFFAGTLWLSIRGLRRVDATTTPTVAAGWPRGRLAIVLGVAVALHLMTFWNLDSSLRQQMATARAEASVLALSVAPPRVPDRENAALIYEQAAQVLTTMDWSKIAHENAEYAGNRDQGWNFNAKDPGLRPFLQRHAATIALLHKAASKPGCYFEHDYYRPECLWDLPERSAIWERGHAVGPGRPHESGRWRRAWGDPGYQYPLCHVPTYRRGAGGTVALICSCSIAHDAVEALQHVLLGTSVSSDDLAALHIEDATSFQKLFERDLRMEEAYRLALFCDMAGRGGAENHGPTGSCLASASVRRHLDRP